MKFDEDTLRQYLYEVHLVQKGVTYSQAFNEKTEEGKELLLFDKILNDLFLLRIDRDPGFYSFVLQEISHDENITRTAIQYINKIIDEYSTSFESFLLHNRLNTHIDLLHHDLISPGSFLRATANTDLEVFSTSPLSGRDLEQIRQFYKYWSEKDLSDTDDVKDAVVRNILERQFYYAKTMKRGCHHSGAFKTPIVDRIISGNFSGKKKWDTIAENCIVRYLRNPRAYIDDYIYNEGPAYHPIYSNIIHECSDLKGKMRGYYYKYLKTDLVKKEGTDPKNVNTVNNIFLSDALLIAAEIWFASKSAQIKINLLNEDYSGYFTPINTINTEDLTSGRLTEWDANEFFQYKILQTLLESSPSENIDENKIHFSNYWYELRQYQKIIDNFEVDFFNPTKKIWKKNLSIPGNLLASYIKTGNHGKASSVIQHLISTELSTNPNPYSTGVFDLVIYEIVFRGLSIDREVALLLVEEIHTEISKYCEHSLALQFMIHIFQDVKWYSQGIAYVEKFIEKYPNVPWNWHLHYENGIMLSESGEAEKALQSFAQAIASFDSHDHVKADIYYRQALVYTQLGRWTEAYTSILNSLYSSYLSPSVSERKNLRNQLKSYLSQHIDVESVRCSDARYVFATAEQQALDYLIKTPDTEELDFYSPVMSLAKGLEILLDQEIWVKVRDNIKKSEFWDEKSGIKGFHDIEPKNLKWALSRYDTKRESISLGTWSRFDVHRSQNHKSLEFINQYFDKQYGSSFEEIKGTCRSLEEHRNGIAHSRVMDKGTANKLFFDSITRINSVIRILYEKQQNTSQKFVITEMENEYPDKSILNGKLVLGYGDFEFADLIFNNILEKLIKSQDETAGELSQEQVLKEKIGSPHLCENNVLYAKTCLLKGIAQKGLKNTKCAKEYFQLAKKYDPDISDDEILETEKSIQKLIEINNAEILNK